MFWKRVFVEAAIWFITVLLPKVFITAVIGIGTYTAMIYGIAKYGLEQTVIGFAITVALVITWKD